MKGPREATLADIKDYTTVVIRLDDATIQGLRRNMKEDGMHPKAEMSSDLTTLLGLNQDYIRSVQNSDVQRFNEILADDFLCSLPDGQLIDRARFLEQTALPVKMVKVFPMAGTKLLISVTLRVPFRLAPFAMAS